MEWPGEEERLAGPPSLSPSPQTSGIAPQLSRLIPRLEQVLFPVSLGVTLAHRQARPAWGVARSPHRFGKP